VYSLSRSSKPKHALSVGPHGQNLAVGLFHGHHRGLAQGNPLALNKNQNRSGAQINADVVFTHIYIHPFISIYLKPARRQKANAA